MTVALMHSHYNENGIVLSWQQNGDDADFSADSRFFQQLGPETAKLRACSSGAQDQQIAVGS